MSEQQTIIFAVDGPVATVTLNRPEVYNALNAPLHQALMDALGAAAGDPAVRCVVITGAGRAFCSGQDLREFAEGYDIEGRLRERYNPLIGRIRSMGKPVIAALNGTAAGAGLSLALACDLRIAAASARLSAAFVNIGLVPDCGMSYFLPRIVGHARALELCLTGAPIDAATAHAWGLVSAVAPDDAFPEAVRQLAAGMANRPALAVSLTKRALEASQHADLDQMLEHETRAQVEAGAHPDFAEGVAAFRAKRPPVWS